MSRSPGCVTLKCKSQGELLEVKSSQNKNREQNSHSKCYGMTDIWVPKRMGNSESLLARCALGSCTFEACRLEEEPARRDSFIVFCAVTFLKGKILSATFRVHSCICPRVCLTGGVHVTPNLPSEHSQLTCLGKVLQGCCSDAAAGGLSLACLAAEYTGSSGVCTVY